MISSPFQRMGSGAIVDVTSTLGYRRARTPLTPFGAAPSGGWPAENDPTRATSSPDYDNWGWDSWWTAQDWITWHRTLKQAYGLDEANRRFVTAWQEQGIGAGPLDARSFDQGFRDYARDNGFLDGLYWGLGSLARPIGTTTDVVTDVTETVSTIGDLSRFLLPVAAIAFGYLFFQANAPRRRQA